MWSKPFCGSSWTTKTQVSGQNRLRLTASIIRPNAKSLSATAASGVGKPGACRCMIVRQQHDGQIRQLAVLFKFSSAP